MDLKQFGERMNTVAVNFEKNVGRNIGKAALVADQRLVNSTPVDTGRARSNWLAGINIPSRQVVEPGAAGEQTGLNAVLYAQHKPGDVIFISNNVHYIVYLNQGSSRQAPAMFVEQAVLEAVAVIHSERYIQ